MFYLSPQGFNFKFSLITMYNPQCQFIVIPYLLLISYGKFTYMLLKTFGNRISQFFVTRRFYFVFMFCQLWSSNGVNILRSFLTFLQKLKVSIAYIKMYLFLFYFSVYYFTKCSDLHILKSLKILFDKALFQFRIFFLVNLKLTQI